MLVYAMDTKKLYRVNGGRIAELGFERMDSYAVWEEVDMAYYAEYEEAFVIGSTHERMAWILGTRSIAYLRRANDAVSVAVPKEVLNWMKKVCNG